MSGIVRSIRFDAADYSVEQGAVKKEVISGLHPPVLWSRQPCGSLNRSPCSKGHVGISALVK